MKTPRLGAGAAALVLAAALVPAGCASTVVVPADDATFARAQRRLAETAARVESLSAPPEDRTLFLQAEAFYRYRFAPPPRGALSYLGEFGAAVTDFPALQAFAGSLDLLELRLRSTDSAIQLWETLLARRPKTALRPLALYRLGWAYPNSDVLGLPRASGAEAFAALAAESPGTPLAALAGAAAAVPMKRKGTAAAWSAFPGLGQLYVREYGSGAVRVGIALASMAAVAVPATVAYQRRADLTWKRDWPLLVASVGGLVVLSFDYTASYEDAMRGVVQWNERAEARFEDAHPDAP
ncbi:MAG TPA: hypothetical protein VHO06_26720 [Polyangia bacterium]|nr:hypothetical protein [Polyangia bacterium]